MNQSYNVNRSVQSIHFKRLTWYNIFRISLSIPLSTLFSVPRYINTHICQSRIYIHTYLLSTCWLFCPRPRPFASSLLRLHLHIYWSKHLMVASIQRILLHAAAYHKSSFQISTLNLCLVYLIRQMKTIHLNLFLLLLFS